MPSDNTTQMSNAQTSNAQTQKIGWYSEKQRNAVWESQNRSYNDHKQRHCAHVYLQPNGKEVIVTSVTSSYDNKPTWDDVQLIGPVTKWVRYINNMHITYESE